MWLGKVLHVFNAHQNGGIPWQLFLNSFWESVDSDLALDGREREPFTKHHLTFFIPVHEIYEQAPRQLSQNYIGVIIII